MSFTDVKIKIPDRKQMEKSGVSLSLCRKTFNPKVIKSFVPELRSRKCFSCFGIPMFYVYVL